MVDVSASDDVTAADARHEDGVADEYDDPDRPLFAPGQLLTQSSCSLYSPYDQRFAYRVEDVIGEGRCCVVYAVRNILLPGAKRLALKCFKRGKKYDGARQREHGVLHALHSNRNIATLLHWFEHSQVHCLVMEMLTFNIRQAIFRNERRGLGPWAVQKFARDILSGLKGLHDLCMVHADLKPANIMWSSDDGCFKILDFGLSFQLKEKSPFQVQTKGYQAPETSEWNKRLDHVKLARRRKRQTVDTVRTVVDSTKHTKLDMDEESEHCTSESSGIFTGSERSPSLSSLSSLSSFDTRDIPSMTNTSIISVTRDALRQQSALGCAIDIWSFGCLLFEAATGSKLFQPGDKLATVLKPQQLVEMRIGATEIEYDRLGISNIFSDLKELITLCLVSRPEERITAAEALRHKFMRHHFQATESDIKVFPCNVLVLKDVQEGQGSNGSLSAIQDKIGDMNPEEVKPSGDNVIVRFKEASQVDEAIRRFTGRDGVMATHGFDSDHDTITFKY